MILRRGDVVAVADRAAGDYTSKPRPAVVVQSDLFYATGSVTVAPLTSEAVDAPLLRLRLEPSDSLPLSEASHIMVDKLTTIRRDRVGRVIGHLSRDDVVRLDRALVVFLGLG
jgi:mRNA interferase MazF